ncbi:suppressor of fused domain protein, partial [bacterium]|nr:suppressor of fused domain protein [bacterium]
DNKAVYFYLNQPVATDSTQKPAFGTRACWVRNLDLGPLVVNETQMRQGISPMLPRNLCIHREGQILPKSEDLRIVWFEEGNGAALLESLPGKEPVILAVIPPWSGLEGFHGYAHECAVESPLCWPMPDNPKLRQRIENADQFWLAWKQQSATDRNSEIAMETNKTPFAELQPSLLEDFDRHFFTEPETTQREYFSVGENRFPPCGIVRYSSASETIIATVGMSVCPQPAVELFSDTPGLYRRIELAIKLTHLQTDNSEANDKKIELATQRLSGLANYPWSQFTWLGPGHTCAFSDVVPGCNSALLVHETQYLPNLRTIETTNTYRNDPVNRLWMVPITESQQQGLQSGELTATDIY